MHEQSGITHKGSFVALPALGKPLVFTQVYVEAQGNLFTLNFVVGPHTHSVCIAKGAARELLEDLAEQFGLGREESMK